MSSLDRLKKEIYRPDIGEDLNKRLNYNFQGEKDKIPPKHPLLTPKQKKRIKLILGGFLLFLFGIFALTWFLHNNSFSENKVFIKIDGPQKIESGGFLKYDFTIQNLNPLPLEDSRLSIQYPAGSLLQNPSRNTSQEEIQLGQIRGKQTKVVSSYVKIFGPEDSQKIIKLNFSYVPAHLNLRLQKEIDFAVDITTSPLKIVIDSPKIITLNKDITYIVSFINQSDNTFKNVRLRLSYPSGFVLNNFSPHNPDIGQNIWTFAKILPQEQKEFKITGRLTTHLDVVNLIATLEIKDNNQYQPYARAYSADSITPPPIELSIQPSTLVVNPGGEIYFLVNFQNTTDSILKNIALTLQLKGAMLNPKSVIPDDQGIYLEKEGKIIWDSRHISKLALLSPFEGGKTGVRLSVKKFLPLNSYNDKNFTLQATASILPKMVPPELSGISLENSTSVSVKVNTIFKLVGGVLPKGNYPIAISGPRPPVTSQKTSYLISWQLLNYYNDIKDITVESYLPAGVYWEGKWWPKNENINFDPLTGKIVWRINHLRAGAGFTSPVKQVIFKVSVVPSPSQAGEKLLLLGKTYAQAKDEFTNSSLSSSLDQSESFQKVQASY